jgi:lipopolysaccharide transport system permease protein
MVIFLPLLYIPLVLLVLGAGWFLASLGVYVRDIGQVVSVVITVLFFLTPIFYPASAVPGRMHLITKINPLAMIVEDFRDLLVWSQMFSLKEWAAWTVLLAALCMLGYIWFIGTKKGFADVF